jgi:hypothetical protein
VAEVDVNKAFNNDVHSPDAEEIGSINKKAPINMTVRKPRDID